MLKLLTKEEEEDKKMFLFLIEQEKKHRLLFDELITMLLKPDEWVESAEFGIREEY